MTVRHVAQTRLQLNILQHRNCSSHGSSENKEGKLLKLVAVRAYQRFRLLLIAGRHRLFAGQGHALALVLCLPAQFTHSHHV